MKTIEINKIYNGDAIQILKTFPDECINCCVTSPPYYALRSYLSNDDPNKYLEIGMDESPSLYIQRLVEVFNEVKRVLRKDGTLWLNIGDSYAGSNQGSGVEKATGKQATNRGTNYMNTKEHKSKLAKVPGFKPKELMMIPARLAIALSEAGWTLRQDIIWQKPNALPESTKDRCTKSHEYIYLFSKQRKYYFNNEAIKEPCVNGDPSSPRGSKGALTPNSGRRGSGNIERKQRPSQDVFDKGNQAGNVPWEYKEFRNKRSVWTVNTKPLHDAHFAVFPEALILPCILAGCPEGGTILDPFFGSGTTGIVAKQNNRNYIGIDLNKEYIELAKTRIEKAVI